MNLSPRAWTRLAWLAAIVACGLLALGLVGYAAGWNDAGGVRYGSNLVPFSLFGGVTLLVLAGGSALARARDRLWSVPVLVPILLLSLISFGFVAIYARHVAPLIRLRADIVMGSESQFVDQVIRYRSGQPQYTPADDANSTPYAPGPVMLTYWIASLAGQSTSIPAYRMVQQLFLAVAVLFCAGSTLALLRFLRRDAPQAQWWMLFWIPFFYLIATNPATNPYTYVLYSDGLGLAANAVGVWLLIKHVTTHDDRWLVPMAVLPALGFLSKQKEVLWLALYVIYFLLSGRLRATRIIAFAAGSAVLVAATVGLSYVLWGRDFWFWNFDVLSRLHVELKEVLQQVKDGSYYLIPGVIGGLLVLRGEWAARLLPAWVCWPVQMIVGIYTSGIAFTPAHFGPATMLGMVWFLAGIATLWPSRPAESTPDDRARGWLFAAAVPILTVFFVMSAGLFREGNALPPGMNRYLADIEHEFERLPRDKVLLDSGSWVYLPTNTVMKDRESPLGVLWGTGASNLQATVDRFRGQYYGRILARKDAFLYRDPQLRAALLDGYQEVRTIPGTGLPKSGWLYPFLLSDVAVLEPRPR